MSKTYGRELCCMTLRVASTLIYSFSGYKVKNFKVSIAPLTFKHKQLQLNVKPANTAKSINSLEQVRSNNLF